MGLGISTAPKYIYQQDAQPSGVVTGAIWVDTNSSPIQTWVYDGSNWNVLTTDVDWLANVQLEQGLNILINSVAAASTLNDWDDMFVDEFTDADGTSNTIDTGNTTAVFNVNKYENSDKERTHPDTPNSDGASQAGKTGERITAHMDGTIISITKESGGATKPTKAYIQSDYTTIIDTATFVGDTATFATPVPITSGTTYWILVDNDGANYIQRIKAGATDPRDFTEFSFIGYVNDSGGTGTGATRHPITLNVRGDRIVQTNVINITANPTGHQVFCHNSTAGTGNLNYDISFDNGVTYVTGQSLNEKNTSVHNGTQMILKLNLNGTGSGNSASADDYGVLLYY